VSHGGYAAAFLNPAFTAELLEWLQSSCWSRDDGLVGTGSDGIADNGHLAFAATVRGFGRAAMSVLERVALVGAVLLAVYLLVALLKPEYFE
jgi:K+-transporting ATPase KdpF subunit